MSSEYWKHTFIIEINMQRPTVSFDLNCTDCAYLRETYPHIADIHYSAMNAINDQQNNSRI